MLSFTVTIGHQCVRALPGTFLPPFTLPSRRSFPFSHFAFRRIPTASHFSITYALFHSPDHTYPLFPQPLPHSLQKSGGTPLSFPKICRFPWESRADISHFPRSLAYGLWLSGSQLLPNSFGYISYANPRGTPFLECGGSTPLCGFNAAINGSFEHHPYTPKARSSSRTPKRHPCGQQTALASGRDDRGGQAYARGEEEAGTRGWEAVGFFCHPDRSGRFFLAFAPRERRPRSGGTVAGCTGPFRSMEQAPLSRCFLSARTEGGPLHGLSRLYPGQRFRRALHGCDEFSGAARTPTLDKARGGFHEEI